jgi:Tfp pilus assembly protein PilN
MFELDLVPVHYHRRRRMQNSLLRLALVYLVAVILLFGGRLAIDRSIARHGQEIETLRIERARAEQELQRLTELRKDREALAQRVSLLEGLRGGVAAKQMFTVVDDALEEEIWFRNWSFRRAGEVVDGEPQAVETGYFIVLPQESKDAPPRAWRFQTHMEIMAESSNHSSLARFVRRLSQQQEIESARILNTQSQGDAASGRVEFELAVLVRSTL